MSDIELVSITNEDVQTINVEISNLTNSVNLELGQNIAAALNYHNLDNTSHSYILDKLAGKVYIEQGKGLSQNDFTNEIKNTYDNYQDSISEIREDLTDLETSVSAIETSLSAIQTENQANINSVIDEINNISYKTKFALNSGNQDLLVNNSNELAFDVDNNNPLTYTNIMGETRTVTDLSPIDVSAENDGKYKVALPQSGNQPYLFDGNVFIQETQPYKDYNIISTTKCLSVILNLCLKH